MYLRKTVFVLQFVVLLSVFLLLSSAFVVDRYGVWMGVNGCSLFWNPATVLTMSLLTCCTCSDVESWRVCVSGVHVIGWCHDWQRGAWYRERGQANHSVAIRVCDWGHALHDHRPVVCAQIQGHWCCCFCLCYFHTVVSDTTHHNEQNKSATNQTTHWLNLLVAEREWNAAVCVCHSGSNRFAAKRATGRHLCLAHLLVSWSASCWLLFFCDSLIVVELL